MHQPRRAIARVLAMIGGLVLAAEPGGALACDAPVHLGYGTPVALEGTLKSGTGHHEAQGDFKYVYLALDQGICVDPTEGAAEDDFEATGTETPVDRIQIAGDANTTALMGKRVQAKGTLFPAHSLWHAEPVLMDASHIAPK